MARTSVIARAVAMLWLAVGSASARGATPPVHTRPPVAPGLAPPKTSLTAVKPPATVVTHDVAGIDFVGSPIQVKDVVGIDFVGAPLIIRDVSGVNFVGTERPLHLATPASAVAVKPH